MLTDHQFVTLKHFEKFVITPLWLTIQQRDMKDQLYQKKHYHKKTEYEDGSQHFCFEHYI